MMSPSKEATDAREAVRQEWPEIAVRAGSLLGASINGCDPGYCHRCNIHPAEVCGYCEGTPNERSRIIARPESGKGGPCFICAREALAGFTFKGKPVCITCAPHSLAGEVMLEFTDTENEAIEAGGAEAGAYLDAIGKTDLADLTPEQWVKFLGTYLHGYSAHMREAARINPPF